MISLNRDEFAELALQILDDGNSLKFRAHGESMNPFIRNGDILEVQPVPGINTDVVKFCCANWKVRE